MTSTLTRSALGAGVLATLLTLGAVSGVPADAAAKSTPCKASMSVPKPKQSTTTVVRVSGVGGGASITTVAHYKSTNTTKTAKATAAGAASVPYKISRATKGYRVVVAVTAVKGSKRWSCSTAFVPS